MDESNVVVVTSLAIRHDAHAPSSSSSPRVHHVLTFYFLHPAFYARGPRYCSLYNDHCVILLRFLPRWRHKEEGFSSNVKKQMPCHMRTRAATVFCIYRFVSSTAATSFPEISLSFRGGASKKMSTNRIDAPSPNRYVTVGGGAINEKKRNIKETNGTKSERISGFNPIKSKSHLMHAIEGMDRYPNYLSRWSEQDMDRLEEGLEHQLQKVRAQKIDVMERRRGIEVMVMRLVEQNEEWSQLLKPPEAWSDVCDEILDSRAATAIFKSKQFACCSKQPTVKQVLNGDVVIQLNPYLLEELMEEEFFDVYSLPLLSIEVSNTEVWLLYLFEARVALYLISYQYFI